MYCLLHKYLYGIDVKLPLILFSDVFIVLDIVRLEELLCFWYYLCAIVHTAW